MSIAQFTTLATQLILFLLAAVTIIDYVRYRDKARLDIALLFGALALYLLFQSLQDRVHSPLLALGAAYLLLAHPYLLLRLVLHFRKIPPLVYRSAWIGMLLSWAVMLVANLLPPLVFLVIVYFVCIEGYATVAFIQGARITGGVTHWRLTLAAVGSGLFATIIFAAGLVVVAPTATAAYDLASKLLAAFAALSFFLGFVSPQRLRQAWQLAELYSFLHESDAYASIERAKKLPDLLCRVSVRAVGGMAAAVALSDEPDGRLTIRAATDERLASETISNNGRDAISLAWTANRRVVARRPDELGTEGARLAGLVGAGALFAVPIATINRRWGVLLVFLFRSPLFASDDLDLLALFAEQGAIILDYASLLSSQESLIQQLHQQAKRLEDANKELEAFAYSVSHDLRAPLRYIAGYVELLQKHTAANLDEKGLRFLRTISDSAKQMGQLIDDLLAFSRLGRAEINCVRVDSTALTEEVIRTVQSEVPDRNITWKVGPLPPVKGDLTLLRQVWINLISNAVKFTRTRGQPVIEIGTQPCENGETAFYIRDNGVGFDMQYADKLFGVFQRLHRADEFEGTGIGLANVRRIVHRHGGRIWAQGAVDHGATFYLTLPIHQGG